VLSVRDIEERLSTDTGHPSIDAQALHDWYDSLPEADRQNVTAVLKGWLASDHLKSVLSALWFVNWVSAIDELELVLLHLAKNLDIQRGDQVADIAAQCALALAELGSVSAIPTLRRWVEALTGGSHDSAWAATRVASALLALGQREGLSVFELILLTDVHGSSGNDPTELPRTQAFITQYLNLYPDDVISLTERFRGMSVGIRRSMRDVVRSAIEEKARTDQLLRSLPNPPERRLYKLRGDEWGRRAWQNFLDALDSGAEP